MGSNQHYLEERPCREVVVDAFQLAVHPVTVGQFAVFVRQTGYRTTAEVRGEANVFTQPIGDVDLTQPSLWWRSVEGANWRAPWGPESAAVADLPVTQVTALDADAYCAWVGARLPSESEWERAASITERPATWPLAIDGRLLANVWLGSFPSRPLRREAAGPTPVGAFGRDAVGCVDLLGNVWELTSSEWDPARRVLKGGSFLCSADFCARYRPSARLAQAVDEPACHIGFRVAAAATDSS